MILKDVFPSYFHSFNDHTLAFWYKEFKEENLIDFLDLFESKMEYCSRIHPDKLHDLVVIFLEDILSSKTASSGQNKELLDFLQFSYAEKCATFFNSNGMFANAHDWLVWSISDNINYGSNVTFLLERIDIFFKSHIKLIRDNIAESFICWMTALFYYSRHLGGLRELARLILVSEEIRIINLTKVIVTNVREERLLDLVCQVLAWSIQNDRTKAFTFACALKDWIPSLEADNQKKAYLQLATGGAEFTGDKPEDFAGLVMGKFGSLCKNHELLHASSIYYTHKFQELEERPEMLSPAFKIYSNSLGKVSRLSMIYEKGRIFGIINGLIMTCLRAKKPYLAVYLLSQFFDKGNNFDDHLFIVLNLDKPGASYISEGLINKGQEMSINDFRDLAKVSNIFLRIKISINDDSDFILEEPKYLGIPDKLKGPAFEAILSKYYNFAALQNKNFKDLIILPGHQHPVQALMIKELGYSAPINCSLEKSKSHAAIKKVLLWCYGTLSSDREAELILHIYNKKDIEVEVLDILNETKESFLGKYASEEYDVIWIGTHGNYNHMLPHKSTISILPDVEITIEEMFIITPQRKEQRLLFLNICDGATSSTNDSLYEHGFGAGLSNSNQCVVSHLWPVETEQALLFGLLYAHLLSQSTDFWESFSKTIEILIREGREGVYNLAIYEQIDVDLLHHKLSDHLEENIYYWGSGVYYC